MKKLLLLPLLFLSFAQAETIQCKAVGVHDGDSITCLTENKEQIKVRLYQIDAPELKQEYGNRAKQALSNMIFGKNVVIETVKKDKYKRTLGTITYRDSDKLSECEKFNNKRAAEIWEKYQERYSWQCSLPTINVNLELIKQGYAWHYPFDTKNPEYIQAEQEAREAKRGLWADKNPIAPWEWRKQKKGKK